MIKVLVIDDSFFSQKSTARFLNKYIPDADISFAGDGLQGFDKYNEINPDYIFLDLLMPRMDGKQFIQLVKEQDRKKIVVLSADVQKSVREEIEQYHILSFINKPIDDEKAQQISEMIRNDSIG